MVTRVPDSDTYGPFDKEAALIIGGSFTAITEAAFHIAAATGHVPPAALESGFKELITAALGLPIVAAFFIRWLVYSAKTYTESTHEAFADGYGEGLDATLPLLPVSAPAGIPMPSLAPLVTFPPTSLASGIVTGAPDDFDEAVEIDPEPEVTAVITDAQNEEINLDDIDVSPPLVA